MSEGSLRMQVTIRGPAAVMASRERAVSADAILLENMRTHERGCGVAGGRYLLRNVLEELVATAATTLLVETNRKRRFNARRART